MLFVHVAVGYVSSTAAAAAAAAEREDTHERTTPHLPETAVLSRKYTSTDKKKEKRKTREWASQGWRERGRERERENREDAVCYIIMISTVSLHVRTERKG